MLLNIGLPAGIVDQVILTQAGPELRKIVAVVPTIVMEIIAGLPKILERTLNLIIVPIAMFYFLKDWPKLMPIVDSLFPPKNPARRQAVLADIDRVLYGYVRGQATVAVLVGILGAIAYSILGIPYAGLLGVILAVSDLVPIVGMIFSAFIVELVIFLTMQLNFAVIASGILVIAGLHLLEVYIIGPRIIGQGIGIPPILMILALLVFGFFFGFVGLLVAVPTTGIILLFLNEYRKTNTRGAKRRAG
jgi:predicted PurR-regulated permease PerM